MHSVIVACENAQEFSDLCDIARKLKRDGRTEVIFFDMAPVYGGKGFLHDAGCFDAVIRAKRVPGRPFGASSPIRKIVVASINAAWLAYHARKRHAGVVLTGVPLLIFRLARMLSFGGFRHVSYIRSIIADSGAATSVSSRVHLATKGIARSGTLRRILSDYVADTFLCVGETTRGFLLARGAPETSVVVVGSVSCDRMIDDMKQAPSPEPGSPVVVFITSAFLWHGNPTGHAAQLELLSELAGLIAEKNATATGDRIRLIVRVHPRDDAAAYDSLATRFGCIEFDRFGPDFFARYPRGSIFLSAVSTLTVELARAGVDSRFVANAATLGQFGAWYEKNEITPAPLAEIAAALSQPERLHAARPSEQYANVIASVRNRVVSETCAEVCCGILRS